MGCSHPRLVPARGPGAISRGPMGILCSISFQPASRREELEGFTSVLLPLTSTIILRCPLTEIDVYRINASINPAAALRIKDTCKQYRAISFHFYLTVLKIHLFRFSNAENLFKGFGDANRPENNILKSIVPFMNLSPAFPSRKASKMLSIKLKVGPTER